MRPPLTNYGNPIEAARFNEDIAVHGRGKPYAIQWPCRGRLGRCDQGGPLNSTERWNPWVRSIIATGVWCWVPRESFRDPAEMTRPLRASDPPRPDRTRDDRVGLITIRPVLGLSHVGKQRLESLHRGRPTCDRRLQRFIFALPGGIRSSVRCFVTIVFESEISGNAMESPSLLLCGIWDQVHAVLERFTETPVDRCQALAVVLQGVIASTKPH
jgi:hypothetical protein